MGGRVVRSTDLDLMYLRCLPDIQVRCPVCKSVFESKVWVGNSTDSLIHPIHFQTDQSDDFFHQQICAYSSLGTVLEAGVCTSGRNGQNSSLAVFALYPEDRATIRNK